MDSSDHQRLNAGESDASQEQRGTDTGHEAGKDEYHRA